LSRVLIVDESAESRDVLRTLFERRGATILEARDPSQAMEVAARFKPNLIVMDAESDRTQEESGTEALLNASDRNRTPILILGTVRRARGPHSVAQIVTKPYHYGQLIRKIDGLLAAV
jgi:DNA-binding response OmpR family regulator